MGLFARQPAPAVTFTLSNKGRSTRFVCQNQEQKPVDFGLTKEQKLLVERVDRLVKERIARRAAQYDQAIEAPREDIQDLHREG
jgi:hypothetical protein